VRFRATSARNWPLVTEIARAIPNWATVLKPVARRRTFHDLNDGTVEIKPDHRRSTYYDLKGLTRLRRIRVLIILVPHNGLEKVPPEWSCTRLRPDCNRFVQTDGLIIRHPFIHRSFFCTIGLIIILARDVVIGSPSTLRLLPLSS
jgi:hypothetical protein